MGIEHATSSPPPVPPTETARLAALERYGSMTGAVAATDAIVRLAAYICATPTAMVSIVEADRQLLLSRTGIEVAETPREVSFCSHTILEQGFLVVPDAHADVRFRDNPLVTGELGIRFYAGAPLRTAEGHALGTLCVIDRVPRELSPAQLQGLRDLADQVVVALELERRTKDQEVALEASQQRLRLALEAGHMGTWDWMIPEGRLEMSETLEAIYGLEPGSFSGRAEDFLPLLHPEDAGEVEQLLRRGVEQRTGWQTEHRAVLPDGTVRWIWSKGRVELGTDGQVVRASGVAMDVTERHHAEEIVRISEERFRSLVQDASDVILVLDADGRNTYMSPAVQRVLGYPAGERLGRSIFEVIHPDDRTQAEEILARLVEVPGSEGTVALRLRHADGTWRSIEGVVKNRLHEAAVAGIVVNYRDVTERRELEERLRHLAFHDDLTGLANRSLFRERVEVALRRRRDRGGAALCYVDLDDFKAVNDSLGHVGGDAVLLAVARRLTRAARDSDLVARIGGDEFAILLEEVADEAEAAVVAQRVLDVLAVPVTLEDRTVSVSASVGVAVVGAGRHDVDALLREADDAMYAVKASGKGRHALFEAPEPPPPAPEVGVTGAGAGHPD